MSGPEFAATRRIVSLPPSHSRILNGLCVKTDCTPSEVVSRAIVLYGLAVLGVEEGKFVGLADDPEKLERAFVGFFKESGDDEPSPPQSKLSFISRLRDWWAR
jgi:hypothetical protein